MNASLPTLYARGNNGKILEWEIEIEDNKYRMITGACGFKKTSSTWTEVQGKNAARSNATSPDEQAILEATAKWEKKKKSGGYWEDVNDIDKVTFVEPMLANKLEDRRDKIDPSKGLIVQVKFNGLRGLGSTTGLHSRKGEKYWSVPHIVDSLGGLFNAYPSAVLDGELFNFELRERLNEIMKLCRKTKNITMADQIASEMQVRYYVYDGYGLPVTPESTKLTTEASPYITRKAAIDRMLPDFTPYYRKVEDYWAYSWEEVDQIYQEFVNQGHEGAMVRLPDSPYDHKRSNNLLKCKPTQDSEFLITSVEQGAGNWSGVAKIIGLRMEDGREFNAAFKGTREEALECLTNKEKYIGRMARIQYNGLTGLGKGIPNFAQFPYNNWKV